MAPLAIWRPVETNGDRRIVRADLVDMSGTPAVIYAAEILVGGEWQPVGEPTDDVDTMRDWLNGRGAAGARIAKL